MTTLQVFHEADALRPELQSHDPEQIARVLAACGVQFEQWPTQSGVNAGASPDAVLDAYREEITSLQQRKGYVTVDVISIDKSHPDKDALRRKFLSEHIHTEDEVRFFVGGRGLFTLHIGDRVYEVLCERGDLLGVPANTPHWFDLGDEPELVAIRFFNNPDGWVAHYTGSAIADRFSRLD
jgi:1,2-dihydroxy-3-keto-5-methylthiopentene dioxygenase